MAFEFFRSESSASPIEKEIEATNGVTYKHGCLVSYGSAGTATTTTAKPEFVYVGKDIVAKTGDKLACTVVFPEDEYITYLSASGSGLKPGMKVTTTGEKATATTASGVFELLSVDGTTSKPVVGRFA